MKLLFVAAQWDPNDIDSGSGVEYQAFTILNKYFDEIEVAGPFTRNPTTLEKVIKTIYERIGKKRLIKFYPSYLRYSNQVVQKQINEFHPDVIFSKTSIPLVNVDIPSPFVYMCDSTVKWVKDNWPPFSKIGMEILEMWERKVINKATHIITFSETNSEVLQNYYHIAKEKISVFPIPAAFPKELSKFEERLISNEKTIRLLVVGKEYHRKGVDIAIEVTRLLNESGIPTILRVVGQNGIDTDQVRFLGLYSKDDPKELQSYIDHYRWAHFMIFPSRFDAAGIVPSEAAAFGLPTITNYAGGLGTTVENGVSGVVLEQNSPPSAYVKIIQKYINDPDAYQQLRLSTYKRYQEKLNWDVLGQKLATIIKNVAKLNDQEVP